LSCSSDGHLGTTKAYQIMGLKPNSWLGAGGSHL
jgi:hypothetical protein